MAVEFPLGVINKMSKVPTTPSDVVSYILAPRALCLEFICREIL